MGARWDEKTACAIRYISTWFFIDGRWLFRWAVVANSNSSNTGTNRTVHYSVRPISDWRYAEEEIRFNLLAVAQRPLPILISQLNELNKLSSTLESHIDNRIPDWKLHVENIPATESQVNSSLISKTIKKGDNQELLCLKKALDRDIALLKMKIIDEEQRISDYMVQHLWIES